MAAITVGPRVFENVDGLEELVIFASEQYNLQGYAEDFDGAEVTDAEYDQLHRALKDHRPDSKAFAGTSPGATVAGKTVKHDPPMTSIDKADGTEEEKQSIYEKWIKGCADRLGVPIAGLGFARSFKRDGVAVRINYVNGKLVSAGLRPQDGVNGTDVTGHVKYVKGVPLTLPENWTLSLNGEIECWLDDFNAINAELDQAGKKQFANPRNYTTGCMGRDDPEEMKNSRLRIAFYSITGFDDAAKYYSTEVERAKWANSKTGLNLQDEDGNGFYVQVQQHSHGDLKTFAIMEEKAKTLPYYTDGIVVKVDNLEHQDELGHTGDDKTKPPRGAIAWKFKEEEAQAVVKENDWNATRTGRVVPRAVFEKSVRLADTDVTYATLNNYGWATKMGVGKGTVVLVKKAGKIIPNVCGVVSNAVKDIGAPTHCPACNFKLALHTSSTGNQDLLCHNPHCGAKHIESWTFFIGKIGGKGLGGSAMEKVLQTGKVRSLADLFALTEQDLMAVGFSERQAILALATIFCVAPEKYNDKLRKKIEDARSKKQRIEAWKFFGSLGIPGAGDTVGKALVQHYRDWQKIESATLEDLKMVSGVGEITAKSIRSWFDDNQDTVDKLLADRFELEWPVTGKLTGKNFCLTGSFELKKHFWQSRIEAQGGNVQSSVGKTTDYLVQEHGKSDGSPSEKEQKAAKHNVPVISVIELEKML